MGARLNRRGFIPPHGSCPCSVTSSCLDSDVEGWAAGDPVGSGEREGLGGRVIRI